jgi:Fic family protein
MSNLPNIFKTSYVQAGSVLNSHDLEFLHQSNAIEQIYSINYARSTSAHLQGHAAAYLNSQSLGRVQKIISHIDLCHWQQLIVMEQMYVPLPIPKRGIGRFRSTITPYNVSVGEYVPPPFMQVPDLMRQWMCDLRIGLIDNSKQLKLDQMAVFCGGLLQRFEAIHPFVDGNGRVGRLFVNYCRSYWSLQPIVFYEHERDAFFAAHSSKVAMANFLRGKFEKAEELTQAHSKRPVT